MYWSAPKDPDVADRYGFVLEDGWLGEETLSTPPVFTAPIESGLTISNISTINLPEISALFSGGNEGFWPIHIRLETPTRQRELCMTLWVRQGC